MSAPASRSLRTWKASRSGIDPFNDSDPAEVYSPVAACEDIAGVLERLRIASLVVIGLSMGGRNAMYFTAKRPAAVQKLVVVDIGPEISARATAPSSRLRFL